MMFQQQNFKDLKSVLEFDEYYGEVFTEGKIDSDLVKYQVVPMARLAFKYFGNDDLKTVYATSDENGIMLLLFKNNKSDTGMRIKPIGDSYSVNVFDKDGEVTMLDTDDGTDKVMKKALEILG